MNVIRMEKLLLASDSIPPGNVLQLYCNRADTGWYTMDKAKLQIIDIPLNKRDFRTHRYGLERTQANS